MSRPVAPHNAHRALEQPANIIPFKTTNPRAVSTLLALEPPPVELSDYPILTTSSSQPKYWADYSVSTHLFPAAFPRCPSDAWVRRPRPEPQEDLDAKKRRIAREVEYLSSIKEAQEQGRDTRPPGREVLWMVANRYVRGLHPTRGTGLTLVFLHGIGAFKESWEPMISSILTSLRGSADQVRIDEIWCLDCVQHGDSGLLNEAILGDIFDNADYARDVANFMLYYLPDHIAGANALPSNLPRVSAAMADARRLRGIPSRTIVMVGHSMGAHSLIYPAVKYPYLFSSLVLVEAAVYPTYLEHKDPHRRFETGCLGRRWIWDTRESAVDSIHRSAYFKPWDPEIIRLYCQYAIVKTADGRFRLKTVPYLEALMLFERRSVYETWELLNEIDSRIWLHWIWGGKSERTGGPKIQAQTSYRRLGNCSNDYHSELRHNLPQEAPSIVATDIAYFLIRHYGRLPESRL
ncbi:alpha/beta-hydrolase [Wolfiporia cocos MD-104 SS10]|uniref:Alpha/beta-hydrolase n=1 Tax=Wolfiporia cocos (strain MD-104) TaxID=742152 RepID=A0A2H3J2E6_WOLCO|nr:alpha/beta-hydrolase [Wolfiporia cocos MD-104 SS10]